VRRSTLIRREARIEVKNDAEHKKEKATRRWLLSVVHPTGFEPVFSA
jgi:hypothetical protein